MGSRCGIAGANKRLASWLVHPLNSVDLDNFPEVLRHEAPAPGEPMSLSVLIGTQPVSSVDMQSEMPMASSTLMANQFKASTVKHAVPSVTVRRSDCAWLTHHDLHRFDLLMVHPSGTVNHQLTTGAPRLG